MGPTGTLIAAIITVTVLFALFVGVRGLYVKCGRPVPVPLLAIYLLSLVLLAGYFLSGDPVLSPVRLTRQEEAWWRFAIGLGFTLSVLIALNHLLLEEYLVRQRGLYLPGPLRLAIQATLFAVVGLVLLRTVLNINLVALIAVPTVLTAVIGFALKDTLTRLFEGIVLGRLMRVGDWVSIVGKEGQVVDITLGHVTLRTRDDDHVTVPNNVVAQKEIVNYSKPTHQHLCGVEVEASFRDPPAGVIEVLRRAAAAVPGVAASPEPSAQVDAFSDSGVRYRVRFWVDDYAERYRIESDVLTYIWYAFRREGMEIPYPVRQIQTLGARAEDAAARADIRARLARIDFLSALSAEELDRLAASVERRVYLPGEAVVRESEVGDEFYYILRGRADVAVATEAGRRVVKTLTEDQHFGEMSLLTGEPRAATVTAASELHLLVIKRPIMQDLFAATPSLAERIGESLVARQAELTRARAAAPEMAHDNSSARQKGRLADRIRRFLGRG